MTPKQKEQTIKLLLKGGDNRTRIIAEKLGLDKNHVHKYLEDWEYKKMRRINKRVNKSWAKMKDDEDKSKNFKKYQDKQIKKIESL